LLLDLRSLLAENTALAPNTGEIKAVGEQALRIAGPLVLTGYAPTLILGSVVLADAGALTLVGQTGSIQVTSDATDTAFQVAVGTLVLAGQTPGVRLDTFLAPVQGALTLTGATVTLALAIQPTVTTLTLTGAAPGIFRETFIAPPRGVLALVGEQASIQAGAAAEFFFPARFFAAQFFAPRYFSQPPSTVAGSSSLTPGAGALDATGQQPSVAAPSGDLGPIPMRRISTKGIRWIKVNLPAPRHERVGITSLTPRPPIRAEVPTAYEDVALTPSTGAMVASGQTPLSEPDILIAPKPMREPAFGVVTLRSEFVQHELEPVLVAVAQPVDSAIRPSAGALLAVGRTGSLTLGTEGQDEAQRWLERLIREEDEALVMAGDLVLA
jgi:hypothetical protein